MYKEIIDFIKELYHGQTHVPLHAPVFYGNEKKYLLDCIDSTYVSYVGNFVTKFEELIARYTGAKYAVATVNGTVGLQTALCVSGVVPGDEVLTQPLTFVATSNAISHCGATPVYIDVDYDTMGMSSQKLDDWLSVNTTYDSNEKKLKNKNTRKTISAIVPVHTFGFPCKIDEIVAIGNKYNIPVIEDSAESMGSFYKSRHTGTFGLAGIFSFNGNKVLTTGGGGMIITSDESLAIKAKHITTTAKVPHKWEFIHDEIGFNYRLTNVAAAIGVAQIEVLDEILVNKRETANLYAKFFKEIGISFILENSNSNANYWLNCIKLNDKKERDLLLKETNASGVMTRPIWKLMNELKMYSNCQTGNLDNSNLLENTIVNIPSGFRKK